MRSSAGFNAQFRILAGAMMKKPLAARGSYPGLKDLWDQYPAGARKFLAYYLVELNHDSPLVTDKAFPKPSRLLYERPTVRTEETP
ncbi:hypothetical protein IF2G_08179 [Cordyceps javanica]|nr:hypothetical protein IF2G_08179 [Cordyceps javanica]